MADPPTDYAALYEQARKMEERASWNLGASKAYTLLLEAYSLLEAELAEAREKADKLARLIVEQEREYAAERKQARERAERAKADYTALARQLTDCQEQLRHCAAELAEARKEEQNSSYWYEEAQEREKEAVARAERAEAALREWRERAATLASAVGVARLHLAAGRPIEALGALDGAAAKTRAALAASEAETERAAATESHAGSMVKPPRSVSASEPEPHPATRKAWEWFISHQFELSNAKRERIALLLTEADALLRDLDAPAFEPDGETP